MQYRQAILPAEIPAFDTVYPFLKAASKSMPSGYICRLPPAQNSRQSQISALRFVGTISSQRIYRAGTILLYLEGDPGRAGRRAGFRTGGEPAP